MVALSKCRRWVDSANNAMIQRASLVSGVDRGLGWCRCLVSSIDLAFNPSCFSNVEVGNMLGLRRKNPANLLVRRSRRGSDFATRVVCYLLVALASLSSRY